MRPAQEPSGPLRVLIVDCHPTFRIAAKALLQTEGLEVFDELERGGDPVLADAGFRPDVVLIDVCLERLDGLDLARRFAAVPQPPAIVLMSAVPADRLLTAAVGADAFVSKAAVTGEALARAATAHGR